MKKYFALLAYFISPKIATAIAAIKALKLTEQDYFVRLDGEVLPGVRVKIKAEDSVKEKALVAKFEHDGKQVVAITRGSNEKGSDRLYINDVEQLNARFDFDIIGWTDTEVKAELYFDEPIALLATRTRKYEIVNNTLNPLSSR